MPSPFYKIFIRDTGEELTSDISNVRLNRSVKKDNELSFDVTFNYPNQVPNNFLIFGTELNFIYGYIGISNSPTHLFRVASRNHTTSNQVVFSIRATDMGILAKKDRKYDDWSNSTASNIVKRICERNGFDFDVTETSKTYEFMPQEGRTDFEMMKHLASIQGGGKFRMFLDGNFVTFGERDLSQRPKLLIDFNDLQNPFERFAVTEVEHNKSISGTNVKSVSTDPNTGELLEERNSSTEKKLAKYESGISKDDVVFDGNARIVSSPKKSNAKTKKRVNSEKSEVILGVEPIRDEMRATADHKHSNDSLENIKGVLSIEGRIDVDVDSICTLQGFMEEDNGNWYIESITDSFNKFISTLTMNRNATNLNTLNSGNKKVPIEDVNKQTGIDNTIKTNEVVFDGNARIVS